MFSHVMVGTNDLDRAKSFYDALLGTLDVPPAMVDRHRIFYRTPTGVFSVSLPIDGQPVKVRTGEPVVLRPGSRVTRVTGIWHEFYPSSDECIIGEVSTANDDLHDNFFVNPDIGRFPGIEEDVPAEVRLVSEA